jgi:hypothetical protein
MSNIMIATAAALIRRGDTVKIVNGQLLPALSNEQHVGAAGEDIPEAAHAYALRDSIWRQAPPSGLKGITRIG